MDDQEREELLAANQEATQRRLLSIEQRCLSAGIPGLLRVGCRMRFGSGTRWVYCGLVDGAHYMACVEDGYNDDYVPAESSLLDFWSLDLSYPECRFAAACWLAEQGSPYWLMMSKHEGGQMPNWTDAATKLVAVVRARQRAPK